MNAVGTTCETQDPWQVLSFVAGKEVMDDLFDTSRCLYGQDCIFEGGPVQFQTQERREAACCNPVYRDMENS